MGSALRQGILQGDKLYHPTNEGILGLGGEGLWSEFLPIKGGCSFAGKAVRPECVKKCGDRQGVCASKGCQTVDRPLTEAVAGGEHSNGDLKG